MTREQAKREIDSLDFYLQNHTDDYGEESHTAMMMAKKALEQEPILDKIRAEIEDRPSCMLSTSSEYERGVNAMLNQVLMIIDKYKAESEKK